MHSDRNTVRIILPKIQVKLRELSTVL